MFWQPSRKWLWHSFHSSFNQHPIPHAGKPLKHRGQTQEPSEEWTAKMNVHCLPLLISVLYTFIYMCISLFRKQSFENMRYLEGHGFNSRWGLRKSFFSVFRLENASSLFTLYSSHQSIYHLFTFFIWTRWALQYGRTHVTHIRT